MFLHLEVSFVDVQNMNDGVRFVCAAIIWNATIIVGVHWVHTYWYMVEPNIANARVIVGWILFALVCSVVASLACFIPMSAEFVANCVIFASVADPCAAWCVRQAA